MSICGRNTPEARLWKIVMRDGADEKYLSVPDDWYELLHIYAERDLQKEDWEIIRLLLSGHDDVSCTTAFKITPEQVRNAKRNAHALLYSLSCAIITSPHTSLVNRVRFDPDVTPAMAEALEQAGIVTWEDLRIAFLRKTLGGVKGIANGKYCILRNLVVKRRLLREDEVPAWSDMSDNKKKKGV